MFGIMGKEDKLNAFLKKCNEQYDEKMLEHYEAAQNIQQLQERHDIVKKAMLTDCASIWKLATSNSKVSSKAETKMKKCLDESFELLKKTFQISKQIGSSKEMIDKVIRQYVSEMDKYFVNHPNATKKEITLQHTTAKKSSMQVTDLTSTSPNIIDAINGGINNRYEEYKLRAEMNELSVSDPAIGIDLGTTMCCVMMYRRGKVELVPNRSQGNSNTTPSYVCFRDDDTDTFGSVAKEDAYRYPETTIFDAKRMIGRQWSDKHLTDDMQKWPFTLVNDNDNPKIITGRKSRFPHEVSARLLAKFRVMAAEHLGLPQGKIRKAVITVPAYFTEPQRRATNEAAQCAGLEVLKIISEPTAAAIAYSWERSDENSAERNALIYDFGGGTFDVSIAKVSGKNVDVLGVNGDTHLGGRDFDQTLMDYCMAEFKRSTGIDLEQGLNEESTVSKNKSKQALARLRLACERTKEILTCAPSSTINVERIWDDKHLIIEITRAAFEDLIRPTVQRTIDIVKAAFKDVHSKGISNKDVIDDIIMIGGSTRVPLVKKMVKEFFGGKELCMHINPDEAVAYGAAIQAAISNRAESVKDIECHDVTPFSLGIYVLGDKFSIILSKNSKIPIENTQPYCTTADNQETILVQIFQGEDPVASKNEKIGSFLLEGLDRKPAGDEKCTVTMKFDDNGMLEVSAKSTRGYNAVTITAERLGMDFASMQRVIREVSVLTCAYTLTL